MRAFVVLGLVFSTPSQEIGLGKRVRNDLVCVVWDVKPQLSQMIAVCSDRLVKLVHTAYKARKLCKHVAEPSTHQCHYSCSQLCNKASALLRDLTTRADSYPSTALGKVSALISSSRPGDRFTKYLTIYRNTHTPI